MTSLYNHLLHSRVTIRLIYLADISGSYIRSEAREMTRTGLGTHLDLHLGLEDP